MSDNEIAKIKRKLNSKTVHKLFFEGKNKIRIDHLLSKDDMLIELGISNIDDYDYFQKIGIYQTLSVILARIRKTAKLNLQCWIDIEKDPWGSSNVVISGFSSNPDDIDFNIERYNGFAKRAYAIAGQTKKAGKSAKKLIEGKVDKHLF